MRFLFCTIYGMLKEGREKEMRFVFMTIGVKFCGGCNTRYNRSQQVNILKSKFPEHEFRTPADGNINDIWLLVCGCRRACISTEGLGARKKMFLLDTPRSFLDVEKYLTEESEKAEQGGEQSLEPSAAKRSENSCGTAEGIGTEADSSMVSLGSEAVWKTKKQLRVGQEAEFSKTFTRSDVEKFALLTGDFSRLHTDDNFAAFSVYGRPVVHGVLAASLISTVMGMELPGEGTIFVGEEVRFLKPVFYGDTITAKVRLISCRERADQYIGTLSGICVNQDGEVVVSARCRQMMDKKLFWVENPEETAEELG